MEKKLKAGTYALRINSKKRHPRKQFAHGRHMVEVLPYLYDLDQKEVDLLATDGPSAWIEIVDKKGVKTKTPTKKEMGAKERLSLELKEKGVELNGKETMEQLEELMIKEMNK